VTVSTPGYQSSAGHIRNYKKGDMSYVVLARRFRPQTFDEVLGQTHVTRTLSNAIKNDRVAHAYLFSGARGVGKTSVARILAKSINCEKGPTPHPCGECGSCRDTVSGSSLDVIEIDGASNNSVEDVRNLREQVKYMSAQGRTRIFIIDEVHMLSTSAFNALLKTLEEPPPRVIFIFATTEQHKIPATINSRCQHFEFRRIAAPIIAARLKEICEAEGVDASDEALATIARQATGSLRDSQSLLDRFISTGETKIDQRLVSDLLGLVGRGTILKLGSVVCERDAGGCMEQVVDIYNSGYDLAQFCREFLEHWRNVALARSIKNVAPLIDCADEELAEIKLQAGTLKPSEADWLFAIFSRAAEDIIRSDNQRLLLEMTLLKMATRPDAEEISELIKRFEFLEKKLGGRPGPSGGGGPGQGGRPVSQQRPASVPASGFKRPFPGNRTEASVAPPEGASSPSNPLPRNQATGPPPAQATAVQEQEVTAPSYEPRDRPVDIDKDWSDLLRYVSGQNKLLGGHLNDAYPVRLDEELLEIGVISPFNYNRLCDPVKQKQLQKLASAYIGREVEISVIEHNPDLQKIPTVTEEQNEQKKKQQAQDEQLKKEAREHPVTAMILDEFEGSRLLDVRLSALGKKQANKEKPND
jgi:DNA polymerase III subunit gamma/tau